MKTSQPAARSHGLRFVQILFLTLALLLGAGCSGVYVNRPIGEKPHALVAADWEGIWLADGDVAKAKIVDAAAGQLQLVRWEEENGQHRLITSRVFITELGSTLFASLREEGEDTGAKPYVWARIRRDPDQVLVWWPDLKRFGELVRSGKLSGKLDGDNVLLDSPTAAQLTALVSGELGQVFDADTPGLLRRVAR